MKLYAVVLASGRSKRFGGDKLGHMLEGKTIAQRSLEALDTPLLEQVFVVTGNEAAASAARSLGFTVVENRSTVNDQAQTIRLGAAALPADADGCLFCVCDQPWLTRRSVERLCTGFANAPANICALAHGGKRGSPVLFPRDLLPALSALPDGETGRYVLAREAHRLTLVEAPAQELRDVDTPDDLSADRQTEPGPAAGGV